LHCGNIALSAIKQWLIFVLKMKILKICGRTADHLYFTACMNFKNAPVII
jgi:hypothetical protein